MRGSLASPSYVDGFRGRWCLRIDAVDLESSKLGFRSRDGLDLGWPVLTGLKLQMIPAWQSQIQLEFPVYDCIDDSPDLTTKKSLASKGCADGATLDSLCLYCIAERK